MADPFVVYLYKEEVSNPLGLPSVDAQLVCLLRLL